MKQPSKLYPPQSTSAQLLTTSEPPWETLGLGAAAGGPLPTSQHCCSTEFSTQYWRLQPPGHANPHWIDMSFVDYAKGMAD